MASNQGSGTIFSASVQKNNSTIHAEAGINKNGDKGASFGLTTPCSNATVSVVMPKGQNRLNFGGSMGFK
jgi:hypothetical protein